ncbi:MAG: hypothetical protein AAGD00_10870 [Planctomycetota bacterium]
MIGMRVAVASATVGIGALGASAATTFTTVFGPGGDAGLLVPESSVLNGIDSIATFGAANNAVGPLAGSANVGETLFFQVGPLYVGGAGPASSNPLSAQGEANLGGAVANNRAYGVIGEGRSDITFASGSVTDIFLQVRGTADGQTTGTNPGTNFGGVPTDLADAAGTLLVWTEFGVEATLQVSNDDYQLFSLSAADFLGDSITRVSIINQGPANSVVALGELTTIPAPGALGVAALAGVAAVRRRRGV